MPPRKKIKSIIDEKSDKEESTIPVKEEKLTLERASSSEEEESEESSASETDESSLEQKKKRGRKKAAAKAKSPGKAKKPGKKAGSGKSKKTKEKEAGNGFSKIKYTNLRNFWLTEPSYQSAKEYYEKFPINPQDAQLIVQQYGDLFNNLSLESLEKWLADRKISLHSFQTVKVLTEGSETPDNSSSMILPPFSARFPSTSAIQLEDFEMHCNLSGPIWRTALAPFPTLLRFADAQTVCTFHLAIGLSRIGWPSRGEDYELQQGKKEYFEGFYLNNPYPETTRLDETDATQETVGIGNDFPRPYEEKACHDNLLPIWSFSHKIFKVKIGSSTTSHQLSYFIGLPHRGSVRSLAWNPFFQPNNVMLGLLALTCSDGLCTVVIVPTEATLKKHYHSTTATTTTTTTSSSSSKTTISSDFLSIPVINEEKLLLTTIPTKDSPYYVTAVTWSPHELYQLCCGMSDGSLVIYDLKETIQQGLEAAALPVMLMRFQESCSDMTSPRLNGITAVQFCPYDPSLLASGGFDGDVKVWKIGEHTPAFTLPQSAAITDVCWDPHGCGLYYADADTTAVSWERAWCFQYQPRMRSALYSHGRRLGAVWKILPFSYHNQTMLCSVGSDGSICGGFTSSLGMNKQPSFTYQRFFQVNSVANPKGAVAEELGTASANAGTTSSSSSSSVAAAATVNDQEHLLPTISLSTIPIFTTQPSNTAFDLTGDSSTALHTLEHLLIEDTTYAEKFHFLFCGGASGILSVKAFHFPNVLDETD